jgi:hypothetical protein
MILELALRVLFRVIGDGLVRALWPRPSAPDYRPAPRPVIVSERARLQRLALYEAWAAAHGLERTARRGAEYAGTHRGRATEMVTGLLTDPSPKSAEILIRVALPAIEVPTLLQPGSAATAVGPSLQAMATLLDVDGVRDVGVTRGFVRLRFDAFVTTAAFDDALTAFEHALATLDAAEPSPYRGR